jgi:hypothetical protein
VVQRGVRPQRVIASLLAGAEPVLTQRLTLRLNSFGRPEERLKLPWLQQLR